MVMHPKLRTFLVISAKNAVNAVITSTALTSLFHNWNQVAGHHGWIKLLEAIGVTVASREALVWGPKLLAWSTSATTDEGVPGTGVGAATGAGK